MGADQITEQPIDVAYSGASRKSPLARSSKPARGQACRPAAGQLNGQRQHGACDQSRRPSRRTADGKDKRPELQMPDTRHYDAGPTGQALVHVYFEDEPGRRTAMKWLTRDEARRTAANIAKIPAFRRVGLHLKLPPKNQLNFSATLCVAVVRALVI